MSKFTMPEEAERDAIEDAGLTPIERVRLELHLSNEYLRAPELDGDDVEELLKAYDALRAAQEWQDISTAHRDREVWLFTLGTRLGHGCNDDIRFECPSNWTWATMWMPAQVPAPPVAVIADHRDTE